MLTFLRQYGLLQSNNFDITTCPALTGKTAVITGGSDGIGGEIVKHLLLNDISQVIVLARNSTKYQNTYTNVWAPALSANPERIDRVRFMACDNADLAAVDRVGKEILSILTRLDFLFLNAGVAFDMDYRLVNGVESTFAINHLGHFHLTQILTPLLITSMPSRVVVTSSSTHMMVSKKFPLSQVESPTPTTTGGPAWGSMYRYGCSKLANVLFTRALVKRLPEGVVANSFNPGSVATDAAGGWKNLIGELGGRVMVRLMRMLGQTVTQAAATAIYMAVGDAEEVGRGNYFVPIARKEKTSPLAEDAEWAEELWKWSVEKVEKILGELEGTEKRGNMNVPSELLAHPVCLPIA